MSDKIEALLGIRLNEGDIGKIKSQIKGLESNKLNIKANTREATGQIKKLQAQMKALGKPIRVKLITDNGTMGGKGANVSAAKAGTLYATEYGNAKNKTLQKLETDRIRKQSKLITMQGQAEKLAYDANKTGNSAAVKRAKELQTEIDKANKSVGRLDKNKLANLNNGLKEARRETAELNRYQADHSRAIKENQRIEAQAAKQAQRQQPNLGQIGTGMSSAGRGLMSVSAPILAVGALGAKAAIGFESAFAGVNFLPSLLEIVE